MSDSPDEVLEALLARLDSLPGGAYHAAMLRNNPQFVAAIRSIDPNDPDATQKALQAALSALGLDPSALTAMMNMVESLQRAGFDPATADPASFMRAMSSQAAMFDPTVVGRVAAPPSAAQEPRQPMSRQPPAISTAPADPASRWESIAHDATRLIATGNERRGFEALTAALDDETTASYDPSDFARFASLSALLEIMAAESRAAGRQVPLRFATLYQRYALFVAFAEPTPPTTNPEFTAWCAGIVEHASRR